MFHTLAFCTILLFSSANCQISSGNFTSTAYNTPTLVASTTTTTKGLGEYILAALGGSSSTTVTSSTSAVSPQLTANPVVNVFSNTSAMSTTSQSIAPSTVCYSMTNKCFTDITYSAMSIAPTGTGSAYASSCQLIQSSYSSASSSWGKVHSSTSLQFDTLGGNSVSVVSYYKDASTLCDGHARVTYSPAILESTSTTTITQAPTLTSTYTASVGWIFPISSPTCSINPSDCDPLWAAYSTSVSQFDAQKSGQSYASQITAAPQAPPCVNVSQASSNAAFQSSFYACGPCTIFGNGVELLYFPEPTTVSRDMCASTPSATITWFDNDVGVPYNGTSPTQTNYTGQPPVTAVMDGTTFTSGTAYISIATVWTGDRCTGSAGSAITSALLALPSESVLSLRYSQDHFQYFMSQSKVTGYPFNFADMQKPIPFSAWNGQNRCQGLGDTRCDVIYEDDFNPQLAMPPGIRKLSPDWERCNMWYGGLYDPPHALQPATAIASATLPNQNSHAQQTSASPSSTVAPTQPTATALADTNGQPSIDAASIPQETQASATGQGSAGQDQPAQSSTTATNTIYAASGAVLTLGSDTYTVNAASATSIPGVVVNAESNNVVVSGTSTIPFSGIGKAIATSTQVEGVSVSTATYSEVGAVIKVVDTTYTVTECPAGAAIGTTTITANGPASTIDGVEMTVAAHCSCVIVGGSTAVFSTITVTNAAAAVTVTAAPSQEAVITLAGDISAATAYNVPGSTGVAVIDSVTLSQGGSAHTLDNGQVVSLASEGVVVQDASSTFTQSFSSASAVSASTSSGRSSPSPSSSRATTSRSTRTTASSGTNTASATSTSAGARLTVALPFAFIWRYLGLLACICCIFV